MKLRRRPKRKTQQALDALAGATKIWSDLQVGKRAGKGVDKSVKKAKRLRLPAFLRGKPAKAIGAAVAAGGAGALVARKLKGDGPQEYTGPPPSAAAEAASKAPDAPAPLTVAPEPEAGKGVPAAGADALRDSGPDPDTEPAAGASALRDPKSADDAAVTTADGAGAEKPAAKKPAAKTPAATSEDEPAAGEGSEKSADADKDDADSDSEKT